MVNHFKWIRAVCDGPFIGALGLSLATAWNCPAAPFAKEIVFTQPNGTELRLWGQGNEFQAVFETLDGYTVVFVPEIRTYCYARLTAEGNDLVSTGFMVGQGDPAQLGLTKHLRVNPEAARKTAQQNFETWDSHVRVSERWSLLKAEHQQSEESSLMAPPSHTTTGVKCGLCLLIDFDGAPATITQTNIFNYLNGANYTGYGNKGSVKQYFYDNSNGKLTYTNVVTAYIRIPASLHPKSYYDDPTKPCAGQANLLIRDAITILKKLPNYTTQILPKFSALTVNAQNEVVAANVFYAGANSGVWSYGLWPHTDSLYAVGAQALSTNGKKVNSYQISNIGTSLELATFCHENGHLLCGFPDIYDYDYDSSGGAGQFCLMNSTASTTNPQQICAYLKLAAGWATATDFALGTQTTVSVSAAGLNFNKFYRYKKPGVPKEYFLVENRQKSGRDASLPGAGVAIWHIDELGNANNQSLKPNTRHANYEVTLVQADNLWHLENNNNSGDARDLYYKGNSAAGYLNRFSDTTAPAANWWDGNRSGIDWSDFSTNGPTMSFSAQVKPLMIRRDPLSQIVATNDIASFNVVPATSTNLTFQWYKNGLALDGDSRISGVTTTNLIVNGTLLSDAGNYFVVVADDLLMETSRVAQLTVKASAKFYSLDIGDAKNLAGATALQTDGGYDIDAAGTDIFNLADGFRFVYQTSAGDFDIKAQLTRLDDTSDSAKAGLMVRENLTAGSRQVSILTTPALGQNYFQIVARKTANGAATEVARFYGLSYPDNWLRLKREGNLVSVYRSNNGTQWYYLKTIPVAFGANAFTGLAVSGHSTAQLTTASFKNILLQTNTAATLAILPTDNVAQESTTNWAKFTLVASRNGPLEVSYRITGTAVNGVDYQAIPACLTIPDGTNASIINLLPFNSLVAGAPKTIKITLATGTNYTIVLPATAAALILDDQKTTGGLKREIYSSIKGNSVATLTNQFKYPSLPDDVSYTTLFESYRNNGSDYGQVLSGYLTPPSTGNYVFYIASDDAAELWLSTDENPRNARKIAEELNANGYRNWSGNGAATHISAPTALVQGRWYYVKALHKQGSGNDNLSVTWKLPGGATPANGSSPISGNYLAFSLPLTNGLNLIPQITNLPPVNSTGLVHVVTTTNWSANSLASWITITAGSGGLGEGWLTFQTDANPGTTNRLGLIVVEGRTYTVVQSALAVLTLVAQAGGPLILNLESAPERSYSIEASSDLVNWLPVYTNSIFRNLDLSLIDSALSNETKRFYRVTGP